VLLREVEYVRPASVEDAVRLLAEHDGARALAGGQTLINVMKARAASPDVLVDLNRLEELKGIELGSDGTLELGAMTTYTEVTESAEARARPILGEVCAQIADVQVRNRGTIGGNVCSNDPTNHLPPLMVALGATMTIRATGGERTIDGIADGRRIVLGHPKTRESMRAGLAMYFVTLEDGALMDIAERIVSALEIEHFFNIQLVGEHVIEVNPRISTIVYQEDLNLPYLGIKSALGEISPEELMQLSAQVRPTRRALRYFDQVEWDDTSSAAGTQLPPRS